VLEGLDGQNSESGASDDGQIHVSESTIGPGILKQKGGRESRKSGKRLAIPSNVENKIVMGERVAPGTSGEIRGLQTLDKADGCGQQVDDMELDSDLRSTPVLSLQGSLEVGPTGVVSSLEVLGLEEPRSLDNPCLNSGPIPFEQGGLIVKTL
jgi:hypothetical protein